MDDSGLGGATDVRRLEISNLQREFGDVVALEDASLSVGVGEIVGLVGCNGAGKTTLMRSVMGIIEPDRGSITWDGQLIDQTDRLRFGYAMVRLATRIYKATLVRSGPRISWREALRVRPG